eukprot:4520815-Amphidinium_carterae.4
MRSDNAALTSPSPLALEEVAARAVVASHSLPVALGTTCHSKPTRMMYKPTASEEKQEQYE